MKLRNLLLSAALSLLPASTLASSPDQEEWIDLFNGQDLDNWIIKIKGSPLGQNTHNTFRVEDGLLKVRYDQYPEFHNEFGHIFYAPQSFSYYRIELQYRFVGRQVANAPAWARRNNGIMYHTQAPDTMTLDQDFPLSVEYQLLGGLGEGERSTANLCTPGSHVVIGNALRKEHCINSSSATYHGESWVNASLEVHGRELAIHRVEGKEVMRYRDLQQDDGTPMDRGYIALQAESAPIDFKVVRLLNLEGCMDPEATNYKSYLVKHDSSACRY